MCLFDVEHSAIFFEVKHSKFIAIRAAVVKCQAVTHADLDFGHRWAVGQILFCSRRWPRLCTARSTTRALYGEYNILCFKVL